MAFDCPRCEATGTLVIGSVLDLPADARSDEISVQAIVCLDCLFRGVAVYEESRRGRLDDESVDHNGHELTEDDDAAEVARRIAECPRPRHEGCGCATHRELGVTDPRGRWVGLDGLRTRRTFPMRYVQAPEPPPQPDEPLWVPVHWTETGDAEVIYEARVGGRRWTVRVNDFPEDPTVYSLLVEDRLACDFNGWPKVWNRP